MILKPVVVNQLLDEIHNQMYEFPDAKELEIDREFWNSIVYYFVRTLPGNTGLKFINPYSLIDDEVILYRGLRVKIKPFALDIV